MKTRLFLTLLVLLALASCKRETKITVPFPKKAVAIKPTEENKQIQYSEKELLAFMDSIAQLPSKPLQEKAAYWSDSVFRSQENINKQLTAQQFKKLKAAAKSEQMDVKTAENIFGDFKMDSISLMDNGKYSISFFPFDKNKDGFNEYAICLGRTVDMGESNIYFFKSNKLLSKRIVHFRYEYDINHFTGSDGKTIVYYKENFESGSGIWWFNYYFYKYDGDRFIPVLNELEDANLTWPGCRYLRLQSKIVKTNPLTLKMVYRQQFYFNNGPGPDPEITPFIVNDSTFVTYRWNEQAKSLVPDYGNSKIARAEILTYYLEDNELLFINTYYKTLKKGLDNPGFKKELLLYLNAVKNNH